MSANPEETTLPPQRSMVEIEAQLERQKLTDLAVIDNVFGNGGAFNLAQRMAQLIATADTIPVIYQNSPGNCIIALDYASRLKISPILLMQNMHVVHGKPGIEGKLVSAILNSCGLFTRLKYEWKGTDTPGSEPELEFGCRVVTKEISTGDVLEGPWVDWRMVKAEGWQKNSKWTSIRILMFMYRAVSFFGRTQASDVLLGLYTNEELEDMQIIDGTFETVTGPAKKPAVKATVKKGASATNAKLDAAIAAREAEQATDDPGGPVLFPEDAARDDGNGDYVEDDAPGISTPETPDPPARQPRTSTLNVE